MKINTQLLSVNKNKEQGAIVNFACSMDSLKKILDFVEEVRVKFWIEGTDENEESVIGNVSNASASVSSSDSKCKFKIKCPGTENIKTSQLSTLCGQDMEINIELDV